MQPRSAVTIGFFDGVHLGHQALLARVRDEAVARRLEPVAVTFDLHSLEVLHGQGPRRTLLTCAEKVELLHAGGMARVEVIHFTREFAAQSGEEFATRHLVGRLRAGFVAAGHDFRFGQGRACGGDDLRQFGARLGFDVAVLDRIDLDGERISSSLARALLGAGDMPALARVLGRPFALSGEVVEGRRLGRTLGFPTANLRVEERKLLPPAGVYAVCLTAPVRRQGMMNIGVRPTVSRRGELSVEVHLLDFDGDLYGRRLSVAVLERLRDERRFDGLPALAAQLELDREAARRATACSPT